MLLWTFVYEILREHMFSFLLGVYLGMNGIAGLCDKAVFNLLGGTARLFSRVYAIYIPTSSV